MQSSPVYHKCTLFELQDEAGHSMRPGLVDLSRSMSLFAVGGGTVSVNAVFVETQQHLWSYGEDAVMTERYQVGDRVKANTAELIPAGTLGTIHQVLHSVLYMYFVQFDGYNNTHLMHTRYLERSSDELLMERAVGKS